jgi:hypothetical protein
MDPKDEPLEAPPIDRKRERQLDKFGGESGIKDYWARKKAEKRDRHKVAMVDVKKLKADKWAALSPEEQEACRMKAVDVHDARRAKEEAQHELCQANMATTNGIAIAFDLQFERVMDHRGRKSTVSQLKTSYAAMRAAGFAMRPIFLTNESPEMAPILATFEGFRKYPPVITDEPLQQHAATNAVVYLTPDCDTVLDVLEQNTTYIIGAFVDHNSKKGLTAEYATQHGLRMARLPIAENIETKNLCKVLTINHVVNVLISFHRTGDWKEAFTRCLPTRRRDVGQDATAAADDCPEPADESDSNA